MKPKSRSAGAAEEMGVLHFAGKNQFLAEGPAVEMAVAGDMSTWSPRSGTIPLFNSATIVSSKRVEGRTAKGATVMGRMELIW